jgi:hypothetical protein
MLRTGRRARTSKPPRLASSGHGRLDHEVDPDMAAVDHTADVKHLEQTGRSASFDTLGCEPFTLQSANGPEFPYRCFAPVRSVADDPASSRS